jgi:hypothetical protein
MIRQCVCGTCPPCRKATLEMAYPKRPVTSHDSDNQLVELGAAGGAGNTTRPLTPTPAVTGKRMT